MGNKPASDATTAAPMAAPVYNKSACDSTTAAPMAAPTASMSPTQCGNDDTPVTAHRVCDVLEHRGMSGAEVGMNSLCIYIFYLAFALAANVSLRLRCPQTWAVTSTDVK